MYSTPVKNCTARNSTVQQRKPAWSIITNGLTKGEELSGFLVSLTVLACAPLSHQKNYDKVSATHCTGRWKRIHSKLFENPAGIETKDYFGMKSTKVAYFG